MPPRKKNKPTKNKANAALNKALAGVPKTTRRRIKTSAKRITIETTQKARGLIARIPINFRQFLSNAQYAIFMRKASGGRMCLARIKHNGQEYNVAFHYNPKEIEKNDAGILQITKPSLPEIVMETIEGNKVKMTTKGHDEIRRLALETANRYLRDKGIVEMAEHPSGIIFVTGSKK